MKINLIMLLLLWSSCVDVVASEKEKTSLESKKVESKEYTTSVKHDGDLWYKKLFFKKESNEEDKIEVETILTVESSIPLKGTVAPVLITKIKEFENKIVKSEDVTDWLATVKFKVDSIDDLNDRLKVRLIEPIKLNNKSLVIDTIRTENEHINVLLFDDNTWVYANNREVIKDSSIFVKYWDTKDLTPYEDADFSQMPNAIVIDLIDSLRGFHYPYKGSIHLRGKFGIRRGRAHQGIDLPLKTGDPVYATFCGRVRISNYNRGGYGNLVIIRHDNGLETYYGHLSKRFVEVNQWVEAGDQIGLGGSTGRSSGAHLHFETRYYGKAFDPQRLIDFENGTLSRQSFLLKQDYFSIHSKASQNFEDEVFNEEADKKEEAERKARRYHTIGSGDTLGHIAVKYGITVSKVCALNNIHKTITLRLGRKLRIN